MSPSFVNYQIKCEDAAAVATVAGRLVQGRAYVSPPKFGWVTLYDQLSDTQDAYEIGRLGSDLSAQLNTVILVFLVHEDSLFVYYLFDNGDLLDEYNSFPIEADPAAEPDQKVRFAGHPEILAGYCTPNVRPSDLEKLLDRGDAMVGGGFASSVSAEQRLVPLANALQMDDSRVRIGFNDFERSHAVTPAGKLFQKVEGKRIRQLAGIRRVPPRIPPR